MGGLATGRAARGDRQPAAPARRQGRGGDAGRARELIVIDTPPHADSAARAAVEVADLVLIPCRPSAFDLSAIQTTAKLVQLLRKPAFVVFTAGAPNAPRIYAEAGELVEGFGTPPCPVLIPDRAAYRHASGRGAHGHGDRTRRQGRRGYPRTVPWACRQLDMPTAPFQEGHRMSRKPSFANLRASPHAGAGRCAVAHRRAPPSRPRKTSREGRKQIAGFFTPDMSFAMHTLARRQGRSLQALMAEAFNDVLRKHGESPVGE